MQLQIRNVRISLLHEEPLADAVRRKLGLGRGALGQVKITRRAVAARN